MSRRKYPPNAAGGDTGVDEDHNEERDERYENETGQSRDDTAGEDGTNETHTYTEANDPYVEGSGKTAYEVLDAGTVVDGRYFPNPNAGTGKEMIAYLEDSQAQALVDCGVALKKEDEDEPMKPTEKSDEVPA